MKLPNAKLASIDLNKLRSYSLNPQHDRGKHKARLFAAILKLGDNVAGDKVMGDEIDTQN
jgi:hypothetical protein